MQKIVTSIFLYLFITVLCGCISSQKQHIQQLKENYPYGLLGDDYGLLSKEDLAINSCVVEIEVPFPPQGTSPYPYWQCYSVKDVSMICDDAGFDEDEKSSMAILALVVSSNKGAHEYLSRRAIRMNSCNYFQSRYKELTENEMHICASGEFWEFKIDKNKKMTNIWSFDKIKTKKGCSSYFDGGCELGEGCKVKTKKSPSP